MIKEFFLPVFPPSTESATPAPLGKAINTPTHNRFISPLDFISGVGKLVELPHLVSAKVVNNLEKFQVNKKNLSQYLPKNKSTSYTNNQTN